MCSRERPLAAWGPDQAQAWWASARSSSGSKRTGPSHIEQPSMEELSQRGTNAHRLSYVETQGERRDAVWRRFGVGAMSDHITVIRFLNFVLSMLPLWIASRCIFWLIAKTVKTHKIKYIFFKSQKNVNKRSRLFNRLQLHTNSSMSKNLSSQINPFKRPPPSSSSVALRSFISTPLSLSPSFALPLLLSLFSRSLSFVLSPRGSFILSLNRGPTRAVKCNNGHFSSPFSSG